MTPRPAQPAPRQRGGCLTVFLVLMVLGNLLVALSYFFGGAVVRESVPALPEWAIPALGVLGLANAAFAIAILRWKRWGAIGFALSSLAVFAINWIGLGPLYAALGLAGIAFLAILVQPIWREME